MRSRYCGCSGKYFIKVMKIVQVHVQRFKTNGIVASFSTLFQLITILLCVGYFLSFCSDMVVPNVDTIHSMAQCILNALASNETSWQWSKEFRSYLLNADGDADSWETKLISVKIFVPNFVFGVCVCTVHSLRNTFFL